MASYSLNMFSHNDQLGINSDAFAQTKALAGVVGAAQFFSLLNLQPICQQFGAKLNLKLTKRIRGITEPPLRGE